MVTTLYKKDSSDKIRVWQVYTKDDLLVQDAGLLNGKLVQNAKACQAKNIGKANQTTPAQQAKLEMASAIETKLKEGYFKTIAEASKSLVVLPMLAKEYEKEQAKIDWAGKVFVQPKLDGMRCLAILENGKVQLISRKATPIDTLKHIEDALLKLGIVSDEPIIFDGELYAHNKTFQENMSLIKKYRQGETEAISYHIYDMVSTLPFEARYLSALALLNTQQVQDSLIPVPTMEISEAEVNKVHIQHLATGFEGTMIRWSNSGYELNKRSSYLLKYKDFKDIACTIVDVIPSEARPEQGILVCTTPANGTGELVTFKATLKGTFEHREEVLQNKIEYIGYTAEIRFFEYTDDGLPRFPVCVGFRLDK